MFRNSRRHGNLVALGLASVLLGSLSACAGSSSGGPTSADEQSLKDAAAAQARLAPLLVAPTRLHVSAPLKTAPQKGKTFVWMQCDAPQCAVLTTQFKDATAAVGWKLKVINYKTSEPATLVDGMQQALQFKPSAISIVGLPFAVWGSVVPAYKAAGVPIIPMYVGDVTTDDTVIASVAGAAESSASGDAIANWFVSDSKGVGKALLFSVPELGTAKPWTHAFTSNVEKNCAKCSVVPLTTTFADVAGGKVPGEIVSKLQQNPDVKYVISQNVALIQGTSAALKGAGLSGIVISGGSAQKAEESAALRGDYGAVTPTALNFAAWLALDAALRHAEGSTVDAEPRLNQMVITKGSDVQAADSFNYPTDWRAQFKKLWQVS